MGYFKPNTKKAIKLAIAIKGLTASLAAMAYMNDKPNLMFGVMIVGAIANEAINFLSDNTKD
jgi:hypothetical protein|tara:strand:- start:752 stop:937 length:186 start_codon:yes stop_codon:yes gene_type:complete